MPQVVLYQNEVSDLGASTFLTLLGSRARMTKAIAVFTTLDGGGQEHAFAALYLLERSLAFTMTV